MWENYFFKYYIHHKYTHYIDDQFSSCKILQAHQTCLSYCVNDNFVNVYYDSEYTSQYIRANVLLTQFPIYFKFELLGVINTI